MENLRQGFELLLAGFLGTLVSLYFREELGTVKSRIVAVMAGTTTSYFTAPILMEYLKLDPPLIGGITFLTGLFGMSIVSSVMKVLPTVIQNVGTSLPWSKGRGE